MDLKPGRSTSPPPKVYDVRDVECKPGVNHVVQGSRAGVFRCIHCKETWAALDLAINGKRRGTSSES